MIIGLTGLNAAGKGEAAKHLGKKGFEYFSLSDELRAVATERGLDHARENLINLGKRLREELGTGALAVKANERITRRKREGQSLFAVDSIRSPGEIAELRKNDDFTLLGIEAGEELRFERMRRRARPGDPTTLEDFRAMEARELNGEGAGQQLLKCLEEADKIVQNEGTLEELGEKLDKIIEVTA